MSKNENDTPSRRVNVAKFVDAHYGHLDKGVRGEIVSSVIASSDLLMSDNDQYSDPASELAQTMIGFSVRSTLRNRPELEASPVAAKALADAIRAEWEATHETKMSGADYLNTLKRVEKMDVLARQKEAARLALPMQKASDKPADQQSSTVAPRLYRDMTTDELDAVVKQRTGFDVYDLTAAKRRAFHDELRKLDPPKVEKTTMDQAAAKGALNRELTAQERIAAFRRSQGAK